jgi:thiol-disulfide isomerase/thioredoxin
MLNKLSCALCWGLILAATPVLWSQQLKEVPSNALKRGDQAPPVEFEFEVQGPPPAEVNWKALHGKVVILDFWGTWCAPCVADIPHLNELSSRYRGKPVQFIAVGHENPRKVAWFLKKHPMHTWIALDVDLSVYKDYSAFGIPHAVVVDQNGVVAAVLNPKDVTASVIDAVLAGEIPTYPPLTAEAYWNPQTAAQYFLEVGKEEPPAK